MREIIFRGKRIENNEWVYGDLIQLGQSADYWYIMPIGVSGEMYEDEPYPFRENDVMCRCALSKVNPDTLGQYTGLKDKNGKMIFEGDLCYYFDSNCDEDDGGLKVVYEYGGYWLKGDGFAISFCQINTNTDVEVIGNIHDNPELLMHKVCR